MWRSEDHLKSQNSASVMWVPEKKLRLPDLAGKHLHLLNHLASPRGCFKMNASFI